MDAQPNQSQAAKSTENCSRRLHAFLNYSATIAAVVVMLIAIANISYKEYRQSVDLERHGIAVNDRTSFDSLALPGVFCLYVIGTLTGSAAAGWTAFAIGMIVVYVGCGRLLDVLIGFVRTTLRNVRVIDRPAG